MMRLGLQRRGNDVIEVDRQRLRAKVDWWHIRTVRDVGSCFTA
jgi:DNA-binding response OmpR family regulator